MVASLIALAACSPAPEPVARPTAADGWNELLPLVLLKLYPPGVRATPDAPAAPRTAGAPRRFLLVTLFFLAVFMLIGTPWILVVT